MHCDLHQPPIHSKSPEYAPIRDAGKLQSIHSSPQMRQSDGCSPHDQAENAAFPPSAAAPFLPATALHAFDTGATPDNCASILSLQYSIFPAAAASVGHYAAYYSISFPNCNSQFFQSSAKETGKGRHCIQKSGDSTITAPRSRAHAPQSSKPKQSPSGRWASPLRRKRAPCPARYSMTGGAG